MAHSGFGKMTIIKPECKIVIIPQKYITTEGFVYQRIQKLINAKDYDSLIKLGIEVLEN